MLREVARRSGVSHNAAYRHFADRDALLAEVAAVGMERLGEAMQSEMAAVADRDPVARAVAAAAGHRSGLRATSRWPSRGCSRSPSPLPCSRTRPTRRTPPETPDLVHHPYELLGQALDAAGRLGRAAPERREGAEVLCWSAVHGFAVLHLDGPLRDVPAADRDAALESLLDQIERGLV